MSHNINVFEESVIVDAKPKCKEPALFYFTSFAEQS